MGRLRRSHVVALMILGGLLLLVHSLQITQDFYTILVAVIRLSNIPFNVQPYLLNTTASNRTNVRTIVRSTPVIVRSKSKLMTDSATVPVNRRDLRSLYTREIYVSGHDRPHPELCPSSGSHLRLVILVTSAPSHFKARNTIRLKWRHYATQASVAFAFILGVPDQKLLPRIEAEDKLHGDIIMGRFIDSYSNLTLKTLSMLEWVDTYCPHARYLFKTDDDTDINLDRVLEFTVNINATRTIWGKVWRSAKPFRSTKSKYYMSSLQFPKKMYPDYTSGAAYLMTSDCVRLLLKAAMQEPYVRMEDVFITGVLASHLHIQRIHIEGFILRSNIP